jgi:DNA-binding NtrC family response regulator
VLTLARNLVEQHARAQRKPAPSLLPEVEAALLKHTWPGNVRELSSVLERAVVLARGELIASIDLAPPANLPDEAPPPSSLAPSSALEGAPARLEDATLAFQREHVLRALRATGGNREACARLLGLSPATFYRHLQKLELKGYRPDDEGRD